MGRLTPPVRSLLPESWRVDLPVFEGPLDLLLHLVKINEVEIADIPVVRVCDQFHEYLALMEELNLDIAGEYIYEAAMLILLKSRLLLPQRKDEDGEPIDDPKQDLVDRLREYRKLKEAAQQLAEFDSVRRGIWARNVPPPKLDDVEAGDEIDLGEVSLYDLLGALRGVLDRYDKEHPPPFQLALETFSVREQVHRLLDRVDAGRPYDLLEDLRNLSCRAEVVAAFLAILELARLQLMRFHQTSDGEILLYRTTREVTQHDLEAVSA